MALGISEAKRDFNKLAAQVNETGVPVTVYRHNKPYISIQPAYRVGHRRRRVTAEELFEGYEDGPLDSGNPWETDALVGSEKDAWS